MQVNQQVTGSYMGHQFAGIVQTRRPITVKTDGAVEFAVVLSQPITVFGLIRDEILVCAKWDGTPSSYTRYSDSIEAA
jgi:hypothetical protein